MSAAHIQLGLSFVLRSFAGLGDQEVLDGGGEEEEGAGHVVAAKGRRRPTA